MTRYIALLRGINVSGKNIIRMAELEKSFSALGYVRVQTYLQSGNVAFGAGKSGEDKLADTIQAKIRLDFGLDVAVLVLSAGELDKIVGLNPLRPKSGADEKLFHCTFLFKPVSRESFRALSLPSAEGEQAVLRENVILLYCPHGYGKTKLNNSYFERALKVQATTRNWRTVCALQKLCTRV